MRFTLGLALGIIMMTIMWRYHGMILYTIFTFADPPETRLRRRR